MSEKRRELLTKGEIFMDESKEPLRESFVSGVIGYANGEFHGRHHRRALRFAVENGLDVEGISIANRMVSAKFAYATVLAGGFEGGVSGFSNAAFATAVGWVYGGAIGGAYGAVLDTLSFLAKEYELGSRAYDVGQVLRDPEYWEIVQSRIARSTFAKAVAASEAMEGRERQGLTPEMIAAGVDMFGASIAASMAMDDRDLQGIGPEILGESVGRIRDGVGSLFAAAQEWRPKRDPLVLDLDGDGIETVAPRGLDGPLFDHLGDGVRRATGWVSRDDGLLVLDRNGNGRIDNGTELFGDSTSAGEGRRARHGYEALAALDENADGKVDWQDEQFSNLQVWRDLNQDGVSQQDELSTLAELQIASLDTDHSVVSTDDGNGNTITATGQFTRADGTTGETADLDFAENSFHREFQEVVNVTEEATLLPDLRGSGMVRDLREASSLSPALAGVLTQYAAASTRAEQLSLLDELVQRWADTSTMESLVEKGIREGVLVTYGFGSGAKRQELRHFLDTEGSAGLSSSSTMEEMAVAYNASQSVAYRAWLDRMAVLEMFNGRTFAILDSAQILTERLQFAAGDDASIVEPVDISHLRVDLSPAQADLLTQGYEAIRQSTYSGLLLQTRLQVAVDAVDVSLSEGALVADFAAMEHELANRISDDPENGTIDLIELNTLIGADLRSAGWDGWAFMEEQLRGVEGDPAAARILDEFRVELQDASGGAGSAAGTRVTMIGSAAADDLTGSPGADTLAGIDGDDGLFGADGNDHLYGGRGDDRLDGGAGFDHLFGGAGDDILGGGRGSADYYSAAQRESAFLGNEYDGGAGDDLLLGTQSADTYYFRAGDGNDVIVDDGFSVRDDAIQFGRSVSPGELSVSRESLDLLVVLYNDQGSIRIRDWFSDPAGRSQIEQFRFVDGTTWSRDEVTARALVQFGTNNSDEMTGMDRFDDVLSGGFGNDRLNGLSGEDILCGGDGEDLLDGGAGRDLLLGGNGDDVLGGAAGSADYSGPSDVDGLLTGNEYTGGRGNDLLRGTFYADTYHYAEGDGLDHIQEYGHESYQDVLRFGAGIESAEVGFARNGHDMVFGFGAAGDAIVVTDWFLSADRKRQIERVEFADGEVWEGQEMTAAALRQDGSSSADRMVGTEGFEDVLDGRAGDDSLLGLGGRDTLAGGSGNDVLDGGAGADMLRGGSGDDILGGDRSSVDYASPTHLNGRALGNDYSGGPGDDLLRGTFYEDTYRFQRGDGRDVISDEGHASYLDRLLVGENVSPDQVWFSRSEDDLLIELLGSEDSVTVEGWYRGPRHRVEQVSLAEGYSAGAAQVERLVTAMAALDRPGAGESTFPDQTRELLEPLLAVNWQVA